MEEQAGFSADAIDMTEWEIYELRSDDDSDDEYSEGPSFFKIQSPDSLSPNKSDTTVSGSLSGVEPGAESSAGQNNSSAEKNGDVLHVSSPDPNFSSEDSNSSESSMGRDYVVNEKEELKGSSEYVVLEMVDKIVDGDIAKVMKQYRAKHYSALNSDADLMIAKCKMLYERDYHCEVVDNSGGVLCLHYPARIIVPVAKKTSVTADRSESVEFYPNVYTEKTKQSSSSRLRKRFVAPVIMFDNKFICRAGTITVRKTAAFETAFRTTNIQPELVEDCHMTRKARQFVRTVVDVSSSGCRAAVDFLTPGSIKRLRAIDAEILRDLKVQYICDLMIEYRKMFKHVRLSSSEKVNPEIYRDCNIEQMPYPGCGFFRRYHKNNRIPEGLIYNWNRPDADTVFKLTENPSENFPDIVWDNYKEWDLIEMTKNYMKILLLYLAKGKGGLLVHCVSGWDRTPLFISILRVSLWADGVIHQSLDYKDIAYLTLTYDWYLFGHDLPSRIRKKEEIMHFCFKFLPYIIDDEYSLTRVFHQLPLEQRGNGTLPDFKPGVRTAINDVCSYILKAYDKFISGML